MNFICLSLKRNILPFIFLIFAILLILFSSSNLIAAKEGLVLWANNIVPSLFPFFVITELLMHTNIIYFIGKIFDRIMRPLFNVPGECAFAFILGLISGYPTGAKIVSNLRNNNLCTKEEGDRMLVFTNNSGPLFILSFVGISLFGSTQTGILLLITHILSSISVALLFGFLSKKTLNNRIYYRNEIKNEKETVNFNNLGRILSQSITNATSTILLIGGFVVIFSVIISILEQSNFLDILSNILNPLLNIFNFNLSFAKPVFAGLIEFTNGINMICSVPEKLISQNIILCSFILGFGGLSVLLQVFSIISKTDLSIKTYIKGKFLHGILASIYTYIALRIFPTLNLDIQETSNLISSTLKDPTSHLFNLFTILIFILFIIYILKKVLKKERRNNYG